MANLAIIIHRGLPRNCRAQVLSTGFWTMQLARFVFSIPFILLAGRLTASTMPPKLTLKSKMLNSHSSRSCSIVYSSRYALELGRIPSSFNYIEDYVTPTLSSSRTSTLQLPQLVFQLDGERASAFIFRIVAQTRSA
jgi:hypothetical protein